jgi:transposase
LAAQELPPDEREMVEACLRGIDFLDREVAAIDRALAELVLASSELRRLLTLPGVNFVTACALLAAIGDVRRSPTARQLVSYLGLDPTVCQSGSEAARHGRISKQGPGETRHVLVEAAWHAARTTGPLRAFHERVASRRGRNVATVAVARKLAVIAWHMLNRGEDYAFVRPSLTREKLRRLELVTGAERRKGKRNPVRVFATREQHRLDQELAAQAERAYGAASSRTGSPPLTRARVPHRGAHPVGRQAAKQRGRSQPHLLRFSSRSPRPPALSQRSRRPSSHLTFIRSGCTVDEP